MFFIKYYLERRIYYSINEAYNSLKTIDKTNAYQINKFIKFIKLTIGNLNIKLGRKLKLDSSELGTFRFETILRDYLPYYLKLGDKAQLDSLKNHVEVMANSVDKDDNINFKIFHNELVQMSGDIIRFFKDNNLKIIHKSSILNFFKDIDNIKKVVIILFYVLTIVYILKSGNLPGINI